MEIGHVLALAACLATATIDTGQASECSDSADEWHNIIFSRFDHRPECKFWKANLKIAEDELVPLAKKLTECATEAGKPTNEWIQAAESELELINDMVKQHCG